jgi:superfamily II DNA/RNA helicase
MPTGSGKTAVLAGAAFVLRAERALVLTPSRLVREQVFADLRQLRTIRALGALATDVPAPKVASVRKRITAVDQWDSLALNDFVVGIPSSLNAALEGVSAPPTSLFDLILVDEAHHSAAKSWRQVLDHFPAARHVLFTATPFRRDRREIGGRFVFSYELRDAVRDGVFGRLTYEPVDQLANNSIDTAIARQATARLLADRVAGFDHLIMIRTGTRARAEFLADLYRKETDLRLKTVLGTNSLRYVTGVIEQLGRGELDGVICVDMFGEGFDLPNLKVAALHAPHKSLAVILQFIGRFARTTGERLGPATFLAPASDMLIERERLYRQGAAWEEIIPNLSAARARKERETREVLETFEAMSLDRDGEVNKSAGDQLADLSLYTLRPYHHVKVLRAGPDVDLSTVIAFPAGYELVFHRYSREHAAVVYVTREVARPDWSTVEHFDGTQYELFVIHHHQASGLLFICTSRRVDQIYQYLATVYAPEGGPLLRGLSLSMLNKVLLDLEAPRFFNIGKKNALAANRSVSYETIAGPNAHESIVQSDARAYRRGHWFCSAMEGGTKTTIGLSSASKVWSNATTQIPQLIAWCDRLAVKIASKRTPKTASGLDLLSTGEDATGIPPGVIYVNWNHNVFAHPPAIRCVLCDGTVLRRQLLDLDLRVESSDEVAVTVAIGDEALTYRFTYSFETARCVEPVADNDTQIFLDGFPDGVSLATYLNENPPTFYTADFTCLDGFTLHAALREAAPPFDADRFETRDWAAMNVDIASEEGNPADGRLSIHRHLEEQLAAGGEDVVFYDHGSGEIADFVTLAIRGNETHVVLYHCKGSGAAKAGERVDDAYELCGQVAKSTGWSDRRRLFEAIAHRFETRGGRSRFITGDMTTVQRALGDGRYIRLVMQIVAVQPGLSKAKLSGKVGAVLAAVDDFIYGGPCARLRVIGSA